MVRTGLAGSLTAALAAVACEGAPALTPGSAASGLHSMSCEPAGLPGTALSSALAGAQLANQRLARACTVVGRNYADVANWKGPVLEAACMAWCLQIARAHRASMSGLLRYLVCFVARGGQQSHGAEPQVQAHTSSKESSSPPAPASRLASQAYTSSLLRLATGVFGEIAGAALAAGRADAGGGSDTCRAHDATHAHLRPAACAAGISARLSLWHAHGPQQQL